MPEIQIIVFFLTSYFYIAYSYNSNRFKYNLHLNKNSNWKYQNNNSRMLARGSRASDSHDSEENLNNYSPLSTNASSSDVGDEENPLLQVLPSQYKKSIYSDILRVGVPSLAAALCEPILSLVDTYCIGQMPSEIAASTGLAGMLINTAIFNMIAASTQNLMSGTTDVVSKVVGGGKVGVLTTKSEVLSTGMLMALFSGFTLGAGFYTCGDALVRSSARMSESVIQGATSYMRVRALALPAALMNYVIIGFSLGIQEVIAPILLISVSLAANVYGDFALVPKQGLQGAAIATTISSYAGMFVGLIRLMYLYPINLLKVGNESHHGNNKSNSNPIFAVFNWFGRLRSQVIPFWSTSAALFAGKFTDALTYSAGAQITTFVAASLQTNHSAAHQIIMQMWWFLSFFTIPLAMVCQSVLPRDFAAGRIQRCRDVARNVAKLGAVVSLLCALVLGFVVTTAPGLFTNSEKIQALMMTVLPQAVISQLLVNFATFTDGIFIGTGDLRSYVMTCAISTFAAWLCFYKGMLDMSGLTGYWNGMLIFSVIRVLSYLFRLPHLLNTKFSLNNIEWPL